MGRARASGRTPSAFAVPGHTPERGHWVDGVVISVTGAGQHQGTDRPRGFSEKPEQARFLAALASRLQREQLRADWLCRALARRAASSPRRLRRVSQPLTSCRQPTASSPRTR